jgi:uncharacterized protein YjiS (DUF1127 family)
MSLDMIYETEVLGRSVSAANRRADLLNLTRDARALRSNHVAGALLTSLDAFGETLRKLAHGIEAWRKRKATYGELMSLDDRLLSDIGIQRADISAISEATANRGFSASPMHATGTLTRGI